MQFVTFILTGLVRLVLVTGAAIFAASLLMAGLLALVGLGLWSLLRGRWPRLTTGMGLASPLKHMVRRRASAQRHRAYSPGDVIDVSARELR
jgi:hypothetical protein